MLDPARLSAAGVYRGSLYHPARPAPEPEPEPEWAAVELPPRRPAWAVELRQRRTALGVTQEELAEFATVGRATVSDTERGRPTVTERTRRRIRAALDELEAYANG